jgi:hypothetical protein
VQDARELSDLGLVQVQLEREEPEGPLHAEGAGALAAGRLPRVTSTSSTAAIRMMLALAAARLTPATPPMDESWMH